MEPMTVHITLTKTSITMSMATACPRQSGQARQPARQPGQAANQAAMDKNVHGRGLLQAVRPGRARPDNSRPDRQQPPPQNLHAALTRHLRAVTRTQGAGRMKGLCLVCPDLR